MKWMLSAGVSRQFRSDIRSSIVDLRVQLCSEVSAVSEVRRRSSLLRLTQTLELMSCHVVLCLSLSVCVFVCLFLCHLCRR